MELTRLNKMVQNFIQLHNRVFLFLFILFLLYGVVLRIFVMQLKGGDTLIFVTRVMVGVTKFVMAKPGIYTPTDYC